MDNESSQNKKEFTRREFLNYACWTAAGLLAIEAAAVAVASAWPKLTQGSFGTRIRALTTDEARAMPVGTVAYFQEQRFYLSRLEDGIIALYRSCPHLGCVVPWVPDDPSEDKLGARGRFNCPCHSGIFDRYGVVHAGPPPRPMDIFPIDIDGGELVVDTGRIITRERFEESQVTKV